MPVNTCRLISFSQDQVDVAEPVLLPQQVEGTFARRGVREVGVVGGSGVSEGRFHRRIVAAASQARKPAVPDTLARMPEKHRVVVAKPGLDGHDRGAKVVARALRDAGMEVIYTGLHQTPEQIVETAIQEDADAIGLSVLSGAHMTLFPRVIELLRGARRRRHRGVRRRHHPRRGHRRRSSEMGVAKIFTPGATTGEIVEWVRKRLEAATQSG